MKRHSRIIIKGTVIMFIGIVFKTLCMMVQNIVIGHKLGADVLGTFTIANTIFQLLGIFSIFGLYNTINRFAPEYLSAKKENRLYRLLGTTVKFSFIMSVLSALVIFLTTSLFVEIFDDAHLGIVLKTLILGLPFYTLIRIISAIATSFETTKLQALIENILLPFTIFIILLIFVWQGITFTAIPVAYLLGYVINFFIALILIRYTRIKEIDLYKSFEFFDKKYLIYSIPIFFNTLLLFLITWFDTMALGYFRDSKEVGVYNATYSIAIAPRLMLTALSTIFFPTISRLISENKISRARNTYKDVIRVITFITLPMNIFIVIFSREILLIFGKEFDIPILLMLIFSTGVFLNILSGPVKLTLNAFDKQSLVSVNSIIAFLVTVVLNLILTPKWGIIGAAIANSTAVVVHNYTSLIELYILRKFNPYTLKVAFTILFGMISGAILWVVKVNILDGYFRSGGVIYNLVLLLMTAVLYFLSFILIVILFKLYNENDKQLLSLFSRKLKNAG